MNNNTAEIVNKIRNTIQQNRTITSEHAKSFFKTDAGCYAAHDQFIGITVPNLRKIANIFNKSDFEILQELLYSTFNEERLLALFILVQQYQNNNLSQRHEIYQFYMKNLLYVNNWNLVDSSAHLILGAYIWDKDRSVLLDLVKSDVLWDRRIAIVATWYFIRQNDLDWTFNIAILLLNDKQDLIHKAVGWMMREAGKRDENILLDFLYHHACNMPRTMLRYAIEKLPQDIRQKLLSM